MTKKSTNKDIKNKVLMPYLILKSLNGGQTNFTISDEKLLIGRLPDINDIALQPDPQSLVTRHMHCFIEIRNSTGWLIDNASKNGTFLKRNNLMQRISGEIKLQDNDCIMILGELDENEEPKYWQLTYIDPLATKDIVNEQTTIVYNWIQAKLIINIEGKQQVINSLTPLEHKLLRYMDQKNKQNNNVPVMCTYDELISAVWDDIYSHTPNDVNHIVAALRKKIEKDYKNPFFLTNIRGLGYRFITNQ
jgi:DNA-binding winged helix-turn-helix (wHTH) protein